MTLIPFVTDLEVITSFESFKPHFERSMLEVYGKNWAEIFPKNLGNYTEKNMTIVALQVYARKVPMDKVALLEGYYPFASSFDPKELHLHALAFVLANKALYKKMSCTTAVVNAHIFLLNKRSVSLNNQLQLKGKP